MRSSQLVKIGCDKTETIGNITVQPISEVNQPSKGGSLVDVIDKYMYTQSR